MDERRAGETAVIKAVVSDADLTGTRADLIFSVAGKTGQAEQKFLLDALNKHELTGSLSIGSFISASSFSGDGSGLTNVTATTTIPAGTYSSSLQTLGNITSSGNISASGIITALSSNIVTINGGSF